MRISNLTTDMVLSVSTSLTFELQISVPHTHIHILIWSSINVAYITPLHICGNFNQRLHWSVMSYLKLKTLPELSFWRRFESSELTYSFRKLVICAALLPFYGFIRIYILNLLLLNLQLSHTLWRISRQITNKFFIYATVSCPCIYPMPS